MTPLNEQAYNYLQKLIMENHFSYQEVYSETKLSKELGISRTPLRDAVHRLAQEGYIDIIPSKGFMLHQMNRKDVNETFQYVLHWKHTAPFRSVKLLLPAKRKSFLKS